MVVIRCGVVSGYSEIGAVQSEAVERRRRFGDRLRRERVAVGLSQEALAVEAGVSQAAISRAERGQESPEDVLVAIHVALDIPEACPPAPKDPVRRIAWFDERNRMISGARPPAGGSFGAGVVPSKASA